MFLGRGALGGVTAFIIFINYKVSANYIKAKVKTNQYLLFLSSSRIVFCLRVSFSLFKFSNSSIIWDGMPLPPLLFKLLFSDLRFAISFIRSLFSFN